MFTLDMLYSLFIGIQKKYKSVVIMNHDIFLCQIEPSEAKVDGPISPFGVLRGPAAMFGPSMDMKMWRVCNAGGHLRYLS